MKEGKCINIKKIFKGRMRRLAGRVAALALAGAVILQGNAVFAQSFEDSLEERGYIQMNPMYGISKDKRFNLKFTEGFDEASAIKYTTLYDESGTVFPTHEEQIRSDIFRLTPRRNLEEAGTYYLVMEPGIKHVQGTDQTGAGYYSRAVVQSSEEYTGFALESAYFISEREVQLEFSEKVDDRKGCPAAMFESYEVDGTVPQSVSVSGKGVKLTLSKRAVENQRVKVWASKAVSSLEKKTDLGMDYEMEIMYTASGESISGEQIYQKEKVEGSVSIMEDGQSVKNSEISGDMYIGAQDVSLENVRVEGSIYINPGKSGSCSLSGVEAARVEVLSGNPDEASLRIKSLETDILSVRSVFGAYIDIDDGTGEDGAVNAESQIYKTVIDLGVVPVTLSSAEGSKGSYGRIEVSSSSIEDGVLRLNLMADVDSALRLHAGCSVESQGDVDLVHVETPYYDEVILKGAEGKRFSNVTMASPAKISVDSGSVGVISCYSDGVLSLGETTTVDYLVKNRYDIQISDEDMAKISSSKVGDIDSEVCIFNVNLDEQRYTLGRQLRLTKGALEVFATCVFQKELVAWFEIDGEYLDVLEEGTYEVSTLEGEDWIELNGETTSYIAPDDIGPPTPNPGDGKIMYAQATGTAATSITGLYASGVTKVEVEYEFDGELLVKEATLKNGEFSWNVFPPLTSGAKVVIRAYEGEEGAYELVETVEIEAGVEAEIPDVYNVRVLGGVASSVTGNCKDNVTKIEVEYNSLVKEPEIEDGKFSWNIFPALSSGTQVIVRGYEGEELLAEETLTAD